MLLLVCCKYFKLILMHYCTPVPILSFVSPLVTMKFNVLSDILEKPFAVSTSGGDSVVAKRVLGVVPYH